jgi:hypothetical protein
VICFEEMHFVGRMNKIGITRHDNYRGRELNSNFPNVLQPVSREEFNVT